MVPVLIGALIEAAGLIFLAIGTMQHGFPPPMGWLVPAIVLVVVGNGLVVLSIVRRAKAKPTKPGASRPGDL